MASKDADHELTHVQHDRTHCLIPGLFRSFARGQGKKRFEIHHEIVTRIGTVKVQVVGPNLLGPSHLWLLQGLIAMAGPRGRNLDIASPKTPMGKELATNMEPTGLALRDMAVGVSGTFTELAKEMGFAEPDSHSTRACLQSWMKDLYTASLFIVDAKGYETGFRLLSKITTSIQVKTFDVALNPFLAEAVSGTGQYVRIPMSEVRSIKHDLTRLLHQRLCAFINEGSAHHTYIDRKTLYGYIWYELEALQPAGKPSARSTPSDPEEAARLDYKRQQDLERSRRKRLRDSIAELEALGWCFDEVAKGKYKISRPAA